MHWPIPMLHLKRPIVQLPFYGASGAISEIPVGIQPLDMAHVMFWHRHVQPIINTRYVAAPGDGVKTIRADVQWNWWQIAALAVSYNAAIRVPRGRLAIAAGWCMSLELGDVNMPIGMLTAAPAFMCNVRGIKRDRAFVWYLADAPSELFERFGLPAVHGVASALIDTAIQARLDLELDAETLLHAAPTGGRRLQDYYARRMTRLDDMPQRISLLRPAREAQYFWMDDKAGRSFCQRYDRRRMTGSPEEGGVDVKRE